LAASPTVKGVMIYPLLPDSTDSYYFSGESGDDRLYLRRPPLPVHRRDSHGG
jgi:hypothetical protein